jgi:hypothetical protein
MINKTKILLFILLLGIVSIACVGAKKKTEISSVPTTKSTTDTIRINPLVQKEYKVKVGQIISYSFREHASVGISAEYDLSDARVIKYKERMKVYKNPQKEGMTGGDDSSVSLIFEAMEKGSTDLIINELFRGKIQNEFKFKIIVE